ncbi:hypothetical protein [Streptomyces mirabilis]|uniref:hypothetical protein n=1 Tax=Streptomyces mirabilis TaxID=68239 RepID=UPI0036E8B600
MIGAVFGPAAEGELAYARQLVGRLTESMLVLADRAFDSNGLLCDVAARGAQFLVRSSPKRRPPVLALLPDGSYLTFLDQRRATRPPEEYREPTTDEWREFQEHFHTRKADAAFTDFPVPGSSRWRPGSGFHCGQRAARRSAPGSARPS